MRTGISITLKPADRRRLKVLARDRNAPHKHVWRAEIVLLSADGVGTNEIIRRTGKSKTCVFHIAAIGGPMTAPARPAIVSRFGRSIQLGRASATTIPHPVHHARAEPWHRHVVGVVVNVQHSGVVANPSRHTEPPRAVLFVAECHGRAV